MKKALLMLCLLTSTLAMAETQSQFIQRTSETLTFEDRIRLPILKVHGALSTFGEDGFEYGYACQDIGKAQLAIDLALHSGMKIEAIKSALIDQNGERIVEKEEIDFDLLSEQLDNLQEKRCR